ncbi:MAG: GNAT family N-acetyltransferase [Chloroflexota bacterium]
MTEHEITTIRPYTEDDWTTVCAIHDAARPQEVAGVMPPEKVLSMTEAAEDDMFFASTAFVACAEDDRPVGFIAILDELITWLYVAPGWQGKGIGRRLMTHVQPLIGDDGYVNCLASNTPAAEFYRSCGFEDAAVFPGDCEGYPCQVLRLCLPTSRHRERPPKPASSSLLLAGFTDEAPGHPEKDAAGVWRWVA